MHVTLDTRGVKEYRKHQTLQHMIDSRLLKGKSDSSLAVEL